MPVEKLILHASGGIPDQFIVVLVDGVNVPQTAEALAAKYGGRVLAVYEAVLGGFSVQLDAASAAELAAEASVCWVEQDARVSGGV